VTGAPRSGKSALVARLVAERPRWLGIANAIPAACPRGLRLAPAGCPCCTARLALELALVRALRELRPTRVLVELGDAGHRASLRRTLCAGALAPYLEAGPDLALPAASALRAEALEAS